MTSHEHDATEHATSTRTKSSERQFAADPTTADSPYGLGCTPSAAALKSQPEAAQSPSTIRRLFCWHHGSWRRQQQQQQQRNDIVSYPTYFAEARFRVDVVSFCLSITLLTLLSNTRALNNLCTSTTTTTTTTTTTATSLTFMPASCPHRSIMLPFVSLPRALKSAANSQHTMGVPSAQAGAASQLQFPCAKSFLVQSAWVARRLPAVVVLLHIQNKSYEQPTRWLVSIVALAAMFLLPRWYLQQGRMLLVPALLVLPRALSTLTLLQAALAGGPVSPVLQAYLDTVWSGSSKACGVMVYQTLIFPLPGMAQLLTSATWLLLNITNEALLLGPAASLPRILSYTLSNLLLGVAIPCGLHLLYERSLRTQYVAAWHRRQQLPAALDAAVASCAGANTAPPAPAAAALPPPAPGVVPPATPAAIHPLTPAPTAAGVAAGLVATPAGSTAPSVTAACTAAVGTNSPAGQVSELLAAAPARGRPPRHSGRLYRGVTRACHVAVKVHHHDAFEKREAIQANLEATLSHKFNSLPAAFGASHSHQQLSSLPLQQGAAATPTAGASAAPSAAPPTPQRRLYSPLALSTVAIQGCLQLLATAHSLLAASGDVGGPPPAASVAASAAECAGAAGYGRNSDDAMQAAWALQVHDGLAELLLVMQEQVEELYGTEDCRVTISAVTGSTCSTRVGGQVTQSAAAVVQLLPMLVEAGAMGQQEVVVEVAWLPRWWEGVAGAEAEAEVVASCWKGGERVVVRGPLDFGAVCEDVSDNTMGQCSLQLPPHLDAAPLEVYLVATCPGHEGVLLGYSHSMALPAPAARELLANVNHPHLGSDPETHASWLHVLGDVAAVWNLLQPLPDTCAATAATAVEQNAAIANLTAYCAASELPAMVAFLEQLVGGQADGNQATPAHAVAPTPNAPGHPLFPPAANNTPATAPHAAVPSLPGGSSTCSPAGPDSAASAYPPTHQPASAAAVGAAVWQERYKEQYEERYTAWNLQQGRKADLFAALFVMLLWAVLLSMEAWHTGGAPHALRDQAAFAALSIASMSLPWLALALGSERLRARRALVMVLQSALHGAKSLLVAYCWVPQPQQSRDGDLTMFILATLALLFPALQRVDWRQQLVCNFVLQEIPRYVMFANATRCMEGMQVVVPPSKLHAALVPLVAAVVAWVVEHRSKAEYRRLEAATKRKGD